MAQVVDLPVTCGACGHEWTESIQLTATLNPADTVTFASGAVSASCPRCGASVTNTTTPVGFVDQRGSLRMPLTILGAVVGVLARSDRDELLALRREVQRLR